MDDEPLALEQLKTYIGKVPYLQLVAACSDAYKAMKVMNEEHIDAIFADINMPDFNGLDLVRTLTQKPLVVFTTAYANFALEGYKVEAVDYLLKPFGMKEFLAAADKLQRRFALQNEHSASATPAASEDFLYVKTDRRLIRLNIADIRYVVGMSEYVRIFLDGDAKPLMPLTTMKRMEETLPHESFMRIHKSYIVNLNKIRSVSKTNIIMDAETTLPIGDAYRETFYRWVEGRSLGR